MAGLGPQPVQRHGYQRARPDPTPPGDVQLHEHAAPAAAQPHCRHLRIRPAHRSAGYRKWLSAFYSDGSEVPVVRKQFQLLVWLALGFRLWGGAPPSVILISVDTLRADRLSCYGHQGRRTANIDAIAHGGTLFWQVSSPVPLTLPAHVAL